MGTYWARGWRVWGKEWVVVGIWLGAEEGVSILPEQNFAYYCPSAAARAGGGSGRGQAGMTRCRNDEPFLK